MAAPGWDYEIEQRYVGAFAALLSELDDIFARPTDVLYLLTPAFLAAHTPWACLEELVTAANLDPADIQTIADLNTPRLNALLAEHTRFCTVTALAREALTKQIHADIQRSRPRLKLESIVAEELR